MRASGEALLSVDLRYLLLALVLVALDRAGMILRWVILLKASNLQVAAKSAAWIHMVSSFVGSVLPAGVGADAARAYTLARRTSETSEAVASVAVDRVVGVISIATMGAIGLGIWSASDPTAPQGLSVPIAVGTVALGVCTVWADRLARTLLPRPWQSSRVGEAILGLANAVAGYRGHPQTLCAVFLLSLIVQTLRILEAYLLGLGLGIERRAGVLPGLHPGRALGATAPALRWRLRISSRCDRVVAATPRCARPRLFRPLDTHATDGSRGFVARSVSLRTRQEMIFPAPDFVSTSCKPYLLPAKRHQVPAQRPHQAPGEHGEGSDEDTVVDRTLPPAVQA